MPLKKLSNDELIAKKEREQRQAQLKAENKKRSEQALAKIKAKHDLQSQKETKKYVKYNPLNNIKSLYRNNVYAPLFSYAYIDSETPAAQKPIMLQETQSDPIEPQESQEPVKKLKVGIRTLQGKL
jgi:hypothetical protein